MVFAGKSRNFDEPRPSSRRARHAALRRAKTFLKHGRVHEIFWPLAPQHSDRAFQRRSANAVYSFDRAIPDVRREHYVRVADQCFGGFPGWIVEPRAGELALRDGR